MTKEEEIKFFNLTNNQYYVFDNYLRDPQSQKPLNSKNIKRNLNISGKRSLLTVILTKTKIKLGMKIFFYDMYNKPNESQSNYKKDYKAYYKGFLRCCNYEEAKIIVLKLSEWLHFKLNQKGIETVHDFMQYMQSEEAKDMSAFAQRRLKSIYKELKEAKQ